MHRIRGTFLLLLAFLFCCTSAYIPCANVTVNNVNGTTPLEWDMDTAKIFVCIDASNQQPNSNWSLWGISTNCHNCLTQPLLNGITDEVQLIDFWTTINTDFPFEFQLWKDSNMVLDFTVDLGDRGVYLIKFTEQKSGKLESSFETVTDPLAFWSPIFVALAIIITMAFVYAIGQWVYFNKIRKENDEDPSVSLVLNTDRREDATPLMNHPASPRTPVQRLLSLDTFRGASIVVMIFVNYGGGGYWFFDHSKWNGLTFADLVFPWFIWIMGTAIPLSFRSLESKKTSRMEILYKIIRRSVLLYGLGLFLNNGYQTEMWRIPGVLQRFGVSYLVVGLMILFLPRFFNEPKRATFESGGQKTMSEQFNEFLKEFLSFGLHWLIIGLLLLIWLLVTFLLPVPGCPTGYIGPGGIGDFGVAENCTGGAAGYVDQLIYGPNHIYRWPTCRELYHTGAYDPEGTLGYITSVVLCFLGVQSGAILVKHKDHKSRVWRWIFWGIFWGLLGLALCEGKKNGGIIPLNKNLWSISFIFVMAGTGYLALTFFYIVIDILKLWNGSPLKFVGMNPILIYCSHEILGGYFPFGFETPETHSYRLFANIVGVSCWLIIAYRMFQLKFFVNI